MISLEMIVFQCILLSFVFRTVKRYQTRLKYSLNIFLVLTYFGLIEVEMWLAKSGQFSS